jgi:hypothetical protein
MEQPQNAGELRKEIVTQIAAMSWLLGKMSNDDATVKEAREVNLKLSVLVGKALDIPMP